MISKELAKKIRYIEIKTSKVVNDVLAGEYHSAFKGQGMEFDEVRAYAPGDDVRSIDWNVTARTGEPYVKRFVEERELTIYFVVDFSASGTFGSVHQAKNAVAAELCALLAFSAIKNNDKVSLILFTDEIELFVPPRKGVTHVLRLVRELLDFTPKGKGTAVSNALDYLAKIAKRKGVVFVLSDFFDTGFEKQLKVLGRKHEVTAIRIQDPLELSLPDVGLIEIEDAETGKRVLCDTSSAAVRDFFYARGEARREDMKKLFRSCDVGYIPVVTGQDYVHDLLKYFRRAS